MYKELIKIANELDRRGLSKEASALGEIISLAEPQEKSEWDFQQLLSIKDKFVESALSEVKAKLSEYMPSDFEANFPHWRIDSIRVDGWEDDRGSIISPGFTIAPKPSHPAYEWMFDADDETQDIDLEKMVAWAEDRGFYKSLFPALGDLNIDGPETRIVINMGSYAW
jgi:hypothetical protein